MKKKSMLTTAFQEGGSYDLWATPDLPLVELANGLCQVYASLLCRGVYRFTTMRQTHSELLHLSVTPHVTGCPLSYAHFTPISALFDDGTIPKSLPANEVWVGGDEDKLFMVPGHQRMGSNCQVHLGKVGRGGRFILSYNDVPGRLSVAENAYYFSDTTVTFLFRGASTHRVQFSQAKLQHDFDVGIPHKDVPGLTQPGGPPCYPPGGKVALILKGP
jgi:hypothetical protein